MELVRDGIASGIFNDLGSGSHVDLCVITKDKVDYIRPFDKACLKGQRYVIVLNLYALRIIILIPCVQGILAAPGFLEASYFLVKPNGLRQSYST